MESLFHNVEQRRSISPVAVLDDTAQVGQIIDHSGFGAVLYLIAAGTLADAAATFAVLLEHGDAANLSDAAAVPDADLIGTEALAGLTQADDNEVRKLGYKGTKRYSRLTITPTGNSASAPISAVCLLGRGKKVPRSSQEA